jgi:ribonuclease P protein subunit RPR2
MGKKDPATRVPNRQSHARISFLYQAASYFANLESQSLLLSTKSRGTSAELTQIGDQNDELVKQNDDVDYTKSRRNSKARTCIKTDQHKHAVSAFLGSHLRIIGRKSQVKVAQSIKRDICKRCNVILQEGKTSATRIENKSYERQKPWADVLVVTCLSCGMEKRYSVGGKKRSIASSRTNDSK